MSNGTSFDPFWLFITAFVLVVMVVAVPAVAWMRHLASAQAARAKSAPVTRAATNRGRGGEWLLFGLFTLIGSALVVMFLILPLVEVHQARRWVSVECVIESSEVESQSDSDGTTYRPHITYRYRFEGREYSADRHDFMEGWSSGRAGKQAVVDRYPAGLMTNCWVNPAAPDRAVLERGLVGTMAFGLIPLVFVAIGVGGLVYTGRKRRQSVAQPAMPAPAAGPRALAGEPRELRPGQSRTARAFGTLVVAAFWNGISWTIFISVLRDREWIGVAFVSIFLVIGLLLLAAAVFAFLALANPKPVLTLVSGPLRHGPPQTLRWRFTGSVNRLRRLTITLIGRESASYTRGTDRVTDTAVFASEPVFASEVLADIREGEAAIVLPAVAPPGFVGTNNRVEWVLRVAGSIRFWPDVGEEYPVEISGGPLPGEVSLADLPRGEPMTHSVDGTMALGTENGRIAYRPGETLTGAVGWSLPTAPTSAEVRLFWQTAGKGSRDVQVVEVVECPAPAAQDTRSFLFVLPQTPWSVDGRLVSLMWGIELVLEPGGQNVRRELIIAPDGVPAYIANSLPDDPKDDPQPAWRRWVQRRR